MPKCELSLIPIFPYMDRMLCGTIVLKTLTLTVLCKNFSLMSAQARNYQYEIVWVFYHNLVDRMISLFSRIWAESENLSEYGKIRIRFCPCTGKYGSEKARVQVFFTQWSPHVYAQQQYFASRRLRTIESNHPTNLVFIQKRLSIKHNGRAPGYLRPVLQT